MIQRIQTIYLLLTALCMSLAIFLPFSSYLVGENILVFNSLGFVLGNKQVAFMPLYPILISSALFALVSIFLYKTRNRQLMINKINYLLILLVIVLMFIDFGSLDNALVSYGVKESDVYFNYFKAEAALVSKDNISQLINSTLADKSCMMQTFDLGW